VRLPDSLDGGGRVTYPDVRAFGGVFADGKLAMLSRLLCRTHATTAAHVAVRHSLLACRALHTSPLLRAIDMAKADTTARLAELRKLMKERNVDIYSTHVRVGHSMSCS
jgi:hypothetical protein